MEKNIELSQKVSREAIFIHFLDVHHLELISNSQLSKEVVVEAQRALTIAMLMSKRIYIPAASFFESGLCSIVLKKFMPIFEFGYIWLVGSAPTLDDFWLLHKMMYKNTTGKAQYYSEMADLPPIPYLQRRSSVTSVIVKEWDDVIERVKLWKLLMPSPEFDIPKDIEKRWCSVPERIGTAPFVEEHVSPIVLKNTVNPIQSKIVAQIINNLYFSAYTKELNAGVVQDLVFLETQHSIVSYGNDIYYASILETLMSEGILNKIDLYDPLTIFKIKNSEWWHKVVCKSYERHFLEEDSLEVSQVISTQNYGTKRNKKAKIGIITIREDEYGAVTQRLPGNPWTGPKTATLYHRSDNVFIIRCIDQGEGEAQLVASNLAIDIDPSLILLVGIGGAVPENEFSLGDVVFSTRISDMCTEAAFEGGEREIAMAGGPLHPKINRILRIFPTIVDSLEKWNTVESIGCVLPSVNFSPKNFYGNKNWKNNVKHVLKHNFPEEGYVRNRKAVSGTIASGNKLVKDTNLIKQWKKHARQIIAVEMEAAGVYRIASEKNIPFAAIRGISDIVGYKRVHEWTSFACHSAASFALSFIKHPSVLSTLLDDRKL